MSTHHWKQQRADANRSAAQLERQAEDLERDGRTREARQARALAAAEREWAREAGRRSRGGGWGEEQAELPAQTDDKGLLARLLGL